MTNHKELRDAWVSTREHLLKVAYRRNDNFPMEITKEEDLKLNVGAVATIPAKKELSEKKEKPEWTNNP